MDRWVTAAAALSLLASFASDGARRGPTPAPAAKSGSSASATGDVKLGCGFRLDPKKHKALHAVPWAEFQTTLKDRKDYVEKGEGIGGIRCAQTFKATAGAVFYRRYDSGKTSKGAVQGGRSWTLGFGANNETYRREMAICTGWNDMAKAVKCTIRPGKSAYIYIGPGESVKEEACAQAHGRRGEHYPRSTALQVTFHTLPSDTCAFE